MNPSRGEPTPSGKGRPVLEEVSVVIPTLGRPILARSLRALSQGSALPAVVLVVDQGRDPAIAAIVEDARDWGLATEYLPSETRGRAAGVNEGIRRVRTPFLVVTDDDCLAEPDWLRAMHDRLQSTPGAIVTGRIEAAGEEEVAVVVTSRRRMTQRRPRLTFDSLSGGNMGVSREVIGRIGLLDEDPRVATAEDAELAYRALRQGVELVYEPDAGVAHVGWRDPAAREVQYDSYARSHGGFYGKYLRRGDLFIGLRAMIHLARAARRWLRGALSRDMDLARNGRAYTLRLPVGIAAGWRSPMGEVRTPGARPDTEEGSTGGLSSAAPSEPPLEVAVIILTLDQRERTLAALESLDPERGPDVNVLVWDNGSTDGTAEAIEARFPGVEVHRHAENLGVAGGRNAAARLAMDQMNPGLLLFLDNDMVVAPGFVQALRAPFPTRPEVAQTQAKLRFMDEPDLLNDGGGFRVRFWLGRTDPIGYRERDEGQRDELRPCIPCGGAMMVRTSVFREAGGFDETFNPFGPEDLDFSLRVRARGWRALYVPEALAYHAVSHTFEGGDYSELYARHKARNWLVLLRRHAPLHQQAGFFLVGLPLGLAQMLSREGVRGGARALKGWLRGLMDLARPG